MSATIQEQLDAIKPGKNYPGSVSITDEVDGKPLEVTFHLQSYFVGMYCAIHAKGACIHQTGDHNNSSFVSKLKNDIAKAMVRGAKIEIGTLRPVCTNIT